MNSKTVKVLLCGIVIAQASLSFDVHAGVVLTGQNTVYGGSLRYFAAGERWVAPCNQAEQVVFDDAEVECVRRGYSSARKINASHIDSGYLDARIPAHQVPMNNGDRMYCTMKVSVECL